jgi:hypothetical protein
MKPAAFFAILCACLVPAQPAQGAIGVGVADNTLLGSPDGGASFLAVMNDVGLQELRLPVRWDPARPARIEHEAQIQALLPVATFRGTNVALSVQGSTAHSFTSSPQAPAQVATFMQKLARTFPTVRDVIVGNEPNQPYFWQPQYDAGGRNVSAGAYEALLAASYDALKEVDPTINVIGLGLSSRGNDDPGASGNVSTSPVKFIEGVGAAYRSSGRTRPLMDELAYHPYPRRDTDSLTTGILWPNAGATNIGRIKQAVWDAFHGTGQKTVEEGLRMRLDEVGWQVAVPRHALHGYFGAETVKPTTEELQASIYASLVRYAACDASVDSLLFFGLRDESNLARWQAGLIRADGTPRPSYSAVKAAIAQTGGKCAGKLRRWRHATTVQGGSAAFPRRRRLPSRVRSWSFVASAGEDASFDAGIYRVRRGRRVRVLSERGLLDAHVARYVRFRARRLAPGRYVYSIRFRAAANPSRTTMKMSRRFVVYRHHR